MRPIRLTMSAFGPFPGTHEIDFAQLGEHRLFLIHGPTGGGKTTILDAICYAIYGDTSGEERKAEQLRCHFSDAATPTQVTLDFAIGPRRFRVVRRPGQLVPKKRGEGLTENIATAILWDRSDCGESEEGRPLAEQPKKVLAEATRLLGFTSAQFRQVIMLPQGKFRELLLAGSEDREAILQTLFGTEFYVRVQDELKKRARELQLQSQQVRAAGAQTLAGAKAESVEALELRRKETVAAVSQAGERIDAARRADEAARGKLRADEKATERFGEHEKVLEALNVMQRRAGRIERDGLKLKAAERAESARTEEAAARQCRGELEDRKKKWTDADTMAGKAHRADETALNRLKSAEDARAERAACADELARHGDLRQRVGRLEKAVETAKQSAEAVKKLDAALKRVDESLAKTEEEREAQQSQLTKLEGIAVQRSADQLALERAQRESEGRKSLAAAENGIKTHRTGRDLAEEARKRAEGEHQRVKAACYEIQRAWIDARAARLAETLTAGSPCPVCGSLEHPAPARSQGVSPTDDRMKSAHKDVDSAAAALAAAQAAVSQIERELAGEIAKGEGYRQNLGSSADEAVEVIEARLASARQAVQRSAAAGQELPGVRAAIESARARVEVAKSAGKSAEAARNDAAVADAAARAALAECREGVPSEWSTVAALTARTTTLETRIKAIDEAMEKAAISKRQTSAAAATADEAVRAATSELEKAQAAFDAARQAFAARLAELDFASESEHSAAKLVESQRIELRERIDAFSRELSAAADREANARRAIEALTRPDVQQSAESARAAAASLEAAVVGRTTLEDQMCQINEWLKTLAESAAELRRCDEQYATIGRLAEVAGGDNRERLTFNRFVLGFLLDDVLLAASERLKAMSRDRYQLQRKRQVTDARVNSGLDLEVFDAYTGFSRPVATLSGGESFLSALGLALGLADVVQARAGGIHMETMFIDEGFGGLDSETLDLAIRSLTDLLDSGRLVGIISHVTELRERIDARLEIQQTRGSSEVRFVIG